MMIDRLRHLLDAMALWDGHERLLTTQLQVQQQQQS